MKKCPIVGIPKGIRLIDCRKDCMMWCKEHETCYIRLWLELQTTAKVIVTADGTKSNIEFSKDIEEGKL